MKNDQNSEEQQEEGSSKNIFTDSPDSPVNGQKEEKNMLTSLIPNLADNESQLYSKEYYNSISEILTKIRQMKSNHVNIDLERQILIEKNKTLEEKLEEMNQLYVKEKVNGEEIQMDKKRLEDKLELMEVEKRNITEMANKNIDAYICSLQGEFDLKQKEIVNQNKIIILCG